jgi:O-antigen ligase
MAVPFLLSEGMDRGLRRRRRAVSLTLLAPMLLAIQYTNSRGGLLGLGVVLAGYSFQRLGRLAGTVATGTLIVAALLWGPSRLSMLNPSEESAQDRIHAWGAALMMFKSDPLFGVGYGRFTEFHERPAHNSFVHTFAELGILGAFFWVGMCYWLVRGTLLRPAESAAIETSRWGPPLFLSAMGVLTSSCFLSWQYSLPLYTLMGMGACYAAVSREQGADIDPRISVRVILHVLLLTLGGIAATYFTVRLLAR